MPLYNRDEDDPTDPDKPGWQLYVVMWQLGIELDDVPELAADRALWRGMTCGTTHHPDACCCCCC